MTCSRRTAISLSSKTLLDSLSLAGVSYIFQPVPTELTLSCIKIMVVYFHIWQILWRSPSKFQDLSLELWLGRKTNVHSSCIGCLIWGGFQFCRCGGNLRFYKIAFFRSEVLSLFLLTSKAGKMVKTELLSSLIHTCLKKSFPPGFGFLYNLFMHLSLSLMQRVPVLMFN